MNETTHHRESLDELAEEFADRYRRGERPTVEEYAAAHPDLAAEIRDLFPTLAMIEELAPSGASEPDASAQGTSIEVKPLDRIGDFRILREIGRGGMGVVYEAEQESLGRRVALKVLPLHSASDPKMLARFRRESRAAGQLHHTNIVPIFEVGEYGDICWYAMQFIPGQALDEVIKELQRLRAGKFSALVQPSPLTRSLIDDSLARGPELNRTEAYQPATKETACLIADSTPKPQSNRSAVEVVELDFRLCCRNVARIGLQAAEALAYAHARGVIHRDIKPSNLLLDTAGIVWVSDFGLAKTQDHALTETGDIVGTVRYMAPERFRGECDARSDVYSLGVTLYELLTLKPAFDNTDRLKLIESIGSSNPVKPRIIEPEVPRDVETIVLKAIDKDPRRRYPSAQAMAADLRRYLTDEPIQARRVGLAEKAWRWVRRNPVVTALVAFAVIDLLVFFLVLLNQNRRLVTERDAAQTARDELRGTLYASQIHLAQSAFEADNVARTLDILERLRPAAGEPDLRGFEWHYWRRQCQGEESSARLHTGPESIYSGRMGFSPDGRWLVSAPVVDGAFPAMQRTDYHLGVWHTVTGQLSFTSRLPVNNRGTPAYRPPAFTADGQLMATVLTDGALGAAKTATSRVVVRTLHGAKAGQELRKLDIEGLLGPVAFTPGSQQFAGAFVAGGADAATATLSFRDAVTGQETTSIKLGRDTFGPPVFSPDGTRVNLVVAPQPNQNSYLSPNQLYGTIKIWDISAKQEIQTLGGTTRVFAVRVYSPDGRWLAAINPEGFEIVVWDAATGREYRRLPVRALVAEDAFMLGASFLAFSPDNSKLAVGGTWGPTAQVWDVESGRPIRSLKGHTQEITGVAFHRESGRVITIDRGRTIKTWSLPKPAPGRDSPILNCQAISRDGRLIAASDLPSSDTPGISIQEADTGKTIQRIPFSDIAPGKRATHTNRRVDYLTFTPGGESLVVPTDDSDRKQTVIRVFDVSTGKPGRVFPLDGIVEAQLSLHMSEDGQRLTAEWIDNARLGPTKPAGRVTRHVSWNFATGEELLNVRLGRGGNSGMALSTDGTRLAVAEGDGVTVRIDDGTGYQGSRIANPGNTGILSVAFSPDGRRLAIGGAEKAETGGERTYLRLVNLATGLDEWKVHGNLGAAYRMAFGPDGRRLAVASAIAGASSGELKLWDAAAGRELLTVKTADLFPRSLHFSPDGHKLIMLGNLSGIHIWDGTPLPE